MTTRQPLRKSTALLEKIAKHDVSPESGLLADAGLLELFSWGTTRPPRARLKDTLAVLVRQGQLNQGLMDGERLFRVTAKGHEAIAAAHYRTSIPTKPARWNHRWHLVTYQIPDSHKAARNQFLIELKRLGFKRFNPALWIYPYDCTMTLKKIAHHLKIEPYIEIIRADTISQTAKWKKAFSLS